MQTRFHTLPASAGTARQLRSLHFGCGLPGPKTYIQAALHADEVPALLVAHHLLAQLSALEAAGQIQGQVVLVPMANPIGLAQELQGSHFGRFDFGSGLNFNRNFRHFTPALIPRLEGRLGADAASNVALVRAQSLALLAPPEGTVETEAQALKRLLQTLAVDADTVLDLHCDNQAVMHVYCGTPLAEPTRALATRLGAQALLSCRESGDDPFDESLSRHWWELAEHFGARFPIPTACLSTTVELRGETQVDDALAGHDASAIIDFLRDRGQIAGTPAPLPEALCEVTPLEAVQPLHAPHAGVLIFHKAPGDVVQAGELVLEVLDPHTDERTPVHAKTSGLLFARVSRRWAGTGMRLAKIAGTQPLRSGKLLSM